MAGFECRLKSAFSRFWKLLGQVEDEQGADRALFNHNCDQLMQACLDFGTSLGFDGRSYIRIRLVAPVRTVRVAMRNWCC